MYLLESGIVSHAEHSQEDFHPRDEQECRISGKLDCEGTVTYIYGYVCIYMHNMDGFGSRTFDKPSRRNH